MKKTSEGILFLFIAIVSICLFAVCEKQHDDIKKHDEIIKVKIAQEEIARDSSYLKIMEEVQREYQLTRERYEKVILDTIVQRFGNHPGSNSYDTNYKVSYETKDCAKANKVLNSYKKF